MKKIFILLGIGLIAGSSIHAQIDSSKTTPTTTPVKREDPKNGHLSGKIIDNTTKAAIGAASVQVFTITKDSSGQEKELLFTTTSSSGNGDFEIGDLPVFKKLKLVVNAMNYGTSEQNISFFQKPAGATNGSAKPATGQGGAMRGNFSADKDLGTISLAPAASDLGNVTVTSASKQLFQMGIDRKIFNVDKDISSSGQSAQEVLAHIPTVNVDIDGNVTMRNASPQLYVDGLPTTLTLEQIPSDLIDKVELITNPSAKYDASGGGGGIINIVLKKNKKTGYNGGLRAGGDTRWGSNLGGDFSYRQGKFNFSANVGFNQRKNKSSIEMERYNKSSDMTLTQNGDNQQRNFRMLMGNLSLDYLMDNKNTFTVGGGIFNGRMNNEQPMSIDSMMGQLGENAPFSYGNLNSLSKMSFTNYNGKFGYKHLFGSKDNHDITANFQYNSANNNGFTNTNTQSFNDAALTDPRYANILSNTNMDGYRRQWVAQADYENPITENSKLEAGVRAEHTNFYSNSLLSTDSTGVGAAALQPRYAYSSKYEYTEHVYAAYATFTSKIGADFTYQIGARIESSKYDGINTQRRDGGLSDSISGFSNKFPLNLFPSLFLTYNLPNRQDLQFNYTRKINRPNFFQLLPIVDASNPYNLSQGNPALKPEFTSNYELSYNKTYEHSGNFLATVYMRYTSGLITNYQYSLGGDTLMNTYVNANHSYTYGLELTNTIQATKIWNVTLNANLFKTEIDASNTAAQATSNRWSWNAKMNNDIKLPAGLTFQLNASYWGKTVLPNAGGSSSSGGRNGGGFNFSPLGSAQGYIGERFNLDAALKKDWKAKNGNTFSVIASMNDILRTNYNKSFSETEYMTQYQKRLNNPQVFRLTLSWRFGKLDTNLFKRKNNKEVDSGDGGGMIGG
ncbi:MAG: TonB-dependent receptor [Pseudopedobacter saltans]|uniref:TonB-dependent receptor n=1 Tax=Pseudopedobacter saltans TaxID=151895 RepID=A0A2W5F230_9SPHI|nr:MAG: TonB-dependent receptor [Pseudopedobacter saltans]